MVKQILVILVGLAGLIAQMIYFIKDDRTLNSDEKDKPLKLRWHIAGGVIHCWCYFVISECYGYRWGCMMASLTWLLFDGAINTWALKREFFYIGKTALIDRVQQWAAEEIRIDVRLLSAILKISFVAYSLIVLIRYYG